MEELILRFLGINLVSGVVRDIEGELAGLQARADSTGGSLSGFLSGAGSAMLSGAKVVGAATLGVAFGLGTFVKSASDMEYQLNLLVTHANAVPGTIDQLRTAFMNLGPQVGYSAIELAKADYYIQSAGWHDVTNNVQILTAAARTAQMTHADLAQTTYSLVTTMRAMPGAFSDAAQYAGALNAIVGSGIMTFDELNKSLKTGFFGTAKVAGQNLQQVGALMDSLTTQGFPASSAAMTLRNIMVQLPAHMDNAKSASAKAFAAMGLQQNKIAEDMTNHGLLYALNEFKVGLSHVDPAHQLEYMGAIFRGTRGTGQAGAMLTALNLVPATLAGINEGINNFDSNWARTAGTATAETAMVSSAFTDFKISMGEALLPTYKVLAQATIQAFQNIWHWVDAHKALIATIAPMVLKIGGIVTAFLGVGGIILKVAAIFASPLMAVMAIAGAAFGIFAVKSGGVSKALNILGGHDMPFVMEKLHQLADWFNNTAKPAFMAFGEWFTTYVVPPLTAFGTFLITTIIPNVALMVAALVVVGYKAAQVVGTILSWFSFLGPPLMWLETHFHLVELAITAILLAMAVEKVAAFTGSVLGLVGSMISAPIDLGKNIVKGIQNIGDAAKSAWGFLGKMIDKLRGIPSSVNQPSFPTPSSNNPIQGATGAIPGTVANDLGAAGLDTAAAALDSAGVLLNTAGGALSAAAAALIAAATALGGVAVEQGVSSDLSTGLIVRAFGAGGAATAAGSLLKLLTGGAPKGSVVEQILNEGKNIFDMGAGAAVPSVAAEGTSVLGGGAVATAEGGLLGAAPATLGITAALAALVAGSVFVATHWQQTLDFMGHSATAVGGWFHDLPGHMAGAWSTTTTDIKGFFTKDIGGFFHGLPGHLAGAWTSVTSAVGGAFQHIGDLFKNWSWGNLGANIHNGVSRFFGMVGNWFGTAGQWVANRGHDALGAITAFFTHPGGFGAFFHDLPGRIGGALTDAYDAVTAFFTHPGGFGAFFHDLPGRIANTLSDGFNAVTAFFTHPGGFGAFFHDLPGRIAGTLSDAAGAVTAFFTHPGGFGAFFHDLPGRLAGVWNDATTAVKGLFTGKGGIADIFGTSGLLGSAVAAAQSAKTGIGNFFGAVGQGFANAGQGIADFFHGIITGQQSNPPHHAMGGFFTQASNIIVGEAGPEWVLNVPQMRSLLTARPPIYVPAATNSYTTAQMQTTDPQHTMLLATIASHLGEMNHRSARSENAQDTPMPAPDSLSSMLYNATALASRNRQRGIRGNFPR